VKLLVVVSGNVRRCWHAVTQMKLQFALYVREDGPSCYGMNCEKCRIYLEQEASWFVFITWCCQDV